jgi:two-component system, sensor histidine kinase
VRVQATRSRWQRWLARHIEDDAQVLIQFANIKSAALLSLGAALLLSLVLLYTQRVPVGTALAWLAAQAATSVAWLVLQRLFNQSSNALEYLPAWSSWHVLLVTCAGALWGLSIGLFGVPQDFAGSIAVVSSQVTAALGGWLLFSSFYPAILMYSMGVFAPATLAYALQGDWPHAALCMVLHITFVLQGRKVIEVIRVRHEKDALVLQLQQENTAKAQALAAAHEATVAKTRFFAAVSHDLRQPLYSLSLLTGAAASPMPEDQRRGLQQRMQQSVSLLDSLFTQLLQVSQLDAGALQPQVQSIDLQLFMRETAQTFEAQFDQKHAKLHVEPLDVTIMADHAWLQRMVFNLIGNALVHVPRAVVHFSAKHDAQHIILTVQDNGPGIALAEQDKIFEEFYRAKNNPVKDEYHKGFGLGLPIVRRLARAMGTDVHMQSQPGQGSSFWLTLPVVQQPIEQPPVIHSMQYKPTAATVPSATSLLHGACIGVVEDEDSIGQALRVLLESWGAKVVWAQHSDQAMQWEHPFNALIVDYQLTPQDTMNGVQVATSLRERHQGVVTGRTPVLVVSSLDLSVDQTAGFDTLTKPVTPVKLRAWLLNAMVSQKNSLISDVPQTAAARLEGTA